MTPYEQQQLLDELDGQAEEAYLAELDAILARVPLAAVDRAVEAGDDWAIIDILGGLAGFYAFTNILARAYHRSAVSEFAAAIANAPSTPRPPPRPVGIVLPGPDRNREYVRAPGAARPYDLGGPGIVLQRPLTSAQRTLRYDQRSIGAATNVARLDAATLLDIQRRTQQAIAATMQAGIVAGRTVRQITQDIVGRPTATGRRAGGIIGMTGQDATWLANARRQLSSTNPAELRAYLTRKLRDRRFDATVRKAIRSGVAIPAETMEKMVQRYGEKLLKSRAAQLAQTSLIERVSQGREQAIRQLAESGAISLDRVLKEWETQGDEKVRHSHAEIDGQVVPFDQPFMTPSGALLMYPGDAGMGAPLDELENCRCRVRYHV